MARDLRTVGLDPDHARVRLFMDLWQRIQDLPRHLGQHSGGMVLCRGRLDDVVPLENASMPGRVVVQWDKDDCADMGIVKIDLLGLGMMAALQDAFTTINARRPAGAEPVAMWTIPPGDPQVYDMLQRADTVGVFQVESRAQMATLPRLKPANFYDLVVEVALIRPGPITGQMVHPYLDRRAGRAEVVYPHPSLEPILKRTLGVPLFQEQLLRMAMTVAGFTGGQAEELRRAMGFKRSEKRMRAIEGQLRDGMARNGITGEAADRSSGRSPRLRSTDSRVALGELRPDCLRQRVPQGALPGGVLRGAARQPADGVLSPGHAGERRAAARRALRARRRAAVELGVRHRGGRLRAPGAAVRQRAAEAGGDGGGGNGTGNSSQ